MIPDDLTSNAVTALEACAEASTTPTGAGQFFSSGRHTAYPRDEHPGLLVPDSEHEVAARAQVVQATLTSGARHRVW